MSLKDYAKQRDNFALGDGQHFSGFDFPCCDCKHVTHSADMPPCRTCDHNVNAVKDDATPLDNQLSAACGGRTDPTGATPETSEARGGHTTTRPDNPAEGG